MALPLSLVMLLFAGILVAVSMYIVENMVSVSRMKRNDELLMNAAVAGIEQGKIWLAATKAPPRRGATAVTQSDLSSRIIGPLLARNGSNIGTGSDKLEGVAFEFAVYDVTVVKDETFPPPIVLDFADGAPPIKRNPPPKGMGEEPYRYLIKSIASLEGREKIIEQLVAYKR